MGGSPSGNSGAEILRVLEFGSYRVHVAATLGGASYLLLPDGGILLATTGSDEGDRRLATRAIAALAAQGHATS